MIQTTYTVEESACAVTVCVNLTEPQVDILDETVNVYVIDDPNSIHIPNGATLASKFSLSVSISLFSCPTNRNPVTCAALNE